MEKARKAEDNAFRRLPHVIDLTGLGRSQIYAMIKEGEFPRPYRLSKRAIAWKDSELRAWMDSRERTFDCVEAS